jgi:ectoine hydroxylase-related dioxygenase (phytanoyl-CoA dioxygenase family)
VIDGEKQLAGWSLHRDRSEMRFYQTESGLVLPEYITAWTALTAANRDNGCVYVLPRSMDATYDRHDDADVAIAPLDEASMVALPAAAGDVLCWSGRVLHKGGTYRRDLQPPPPPRIAIATAFSTRRYETESLRALDDIRDGNHMIYVY